VMYPEYYIEYRNGRCYGCVIVCIGYFDGE